MYMNEEIGVWTELTVDSQTCAYQHAVAEDGLSVLCCSDHLTTFSVQHVIYASPLELAFKKTIGASPLTYLVALNIALILLVLTGKFLDL